MRRCLALRLRIWWHRRAAKWWYDEYLYHHRAIKAHRRATLECAAKAHERRQIAVRMESEVKS